MAYWDTRIKRTSRKELKKLQKQASDATAQESKKGMWGGWGKTIGAIALPIIGAALAPFTAGTSLAAVGALMTSTVGAAALAGAGAYLGGKKGSELAGKSKEISESDWHQDTRDEIKQELDMAADKREASYTSGALSSAGMTLLTAGLGDTLKQVGAKGIEKLGLTKAFDKVSSVGGKFGLGEGQSMAELAEKAPDITAKNMWEGVKGMFKGSEAFQKANLKAIAAQQPISGAYRKSFQVGGNMADQLDTFGKNIKALGQVETQGPMGQTYGKQGMFSPKTGGFGQKSMFELTGVKGSLGKAAKGIAELDWTSPEKWAPRQLTSAEEGLSQQYHFEKGLEEGDVGVSEISGDMEYVATPGSDRPFRLRGKGQPQIEGSEFDPEFEDVPYAVPEGEVIGADQSGLDFPASPGQKPLMSAPMEMPENMTTIEGDRITALKEQYGEDVVRDARQTLQGKHKYGMTQKSGYTTRRNPLGAEQVGAYLEEQGAAKSAAQSAKDLTEFEMDWLRKQGNWGIGS